jgi:hypothetical protein
MSHPCHSHFVYQLSLRRPLNHFLHLVLNPYMSSHFFWFARRGADEREVSLLQRAYGRSLVSLWLGIIILWLIAKTTIGENILNGYGFATVLGLLILLSILAGASALQGEELEYEKVALGKKPSFILVLLSVLLCALVGGGLIYLNASYLWIALLGFAFIEYVIGAFAAWKWTEGYTLHARLLGSLIFPYQVIGYFLEPKASKKLRALYVALTSFWFMVVPLICLVALSAGSRFISFQTWNGYLVPGVIESKIEGWEPGAARHIILNYQDTDVAVGDIIRYNALVPDVTVTYGDGTVSPRHTETVEKYGRVISVEGDTITVDVSEGESMSGDTAKYVGVLLTPLSHTEVITSKDVVATVLVNAPLADLADELIP